MWPLRERGPERSLPPSSSEGCGLRVKILLDYWAVCTKELRRTYLWTHTPPGGNSSWATVTAAAAMPGKDKGWADMTAGEQRAAGSIGYHEASWDDGMTTESTDKWWVELSNKEQKAATQLGYDKGEWDADKEGKEPPAPAPASRRAAPADSPREGQREPRNKGRAAGNASQPATAQAGKATTLFVGSLGNGTTEKDVQSFFAKFGIRKLTGNWAKGCASSAMRPRLSSCTQQLRLASPRFAHVEFGSADGCNQAFQAAKGSKIKGSKIRVDFAESRGGGGGGGGGGTSSGGGGGGGEGGKGGQGGQGGQGGREPVPGVSQTYYEYSGLDTQTVHSTEGSLSDRFARLEAASTTDTLVSQASNCRHSRSAPPPPPVLIGISTGKVRRSAVH